MDQVKIEMAYGMYLHLCPKVKLNQLILDELWVQAFRLARIYKGYGGTNVCIDPVTQDVYPGATAVGKRVEVVPAIEGPEQVPAIEAPNAFRLVENAIPESSPDVSEEASPDANPEVLTQMPPARASTPVVELVNVPEEPKTVAEGQTVISPITPVQTPNEVTVSNESPSSKVFEINLIYILSKIFKKYY